MAKLGASAGWSGNYAHDLTEASTLGSGDSGKVFFLNSATEFTTTLPACSGNAGFNVTFVIKAAPSGAAYVVSSASSSDYILGSVSAGAADDVADTSDGTDTQDASQLKITVALEGVDGDLSSSDISGVGPDPS